MKWGHSLLKYVAKDHEANAVAMYIEMCKLKVSNCQSKFKAVC